MLGHSMARRKPYKPPLSPDMVPVEVENPYAVGPVRVVAMASTRDDPLRGMLARGQIDQAQFEAGRLWQKYREDSEVGGLKAMDWRREPVDGTPVYPEPITDRQRKAVGALNEARCYLGSYGYALIESVLSYNPILRRGMTIVEAAAERKMVSKRGELYIGRRFVECLESLAVLWGLAGEPR